MSGFEITGKNNTAKVFTDVIDQEAISQIYNMCNQEAFSGSRIRIMPDVSPGKGCTVGTTMTIAGRIVPNLVGTDIGCGMDVVKLKKCTIDFAQLDRVIRDRIPSGFTIRDRVHPLMKNVDLQSLRCFDAIRESETRAALSLGTLGGGNHFIEVDRDDNGDYYLVIHSGSRHLGLAVATYYQNEAIRRMPTILEAEERETGVRRYVPENFAYCEGKLFDDYVHDMKIVQQYAVWSRRAMLRDILEGMGLTDEGGFTTIHNYLDTENLILRKGAVSAQSGERLIIPINMRDGSLICTGKGNPDWNWSAPHGAGRLMSRSQAKDTITLEEYREAMRGIYTTSVGVGTLDESPMAYKSIDDIFDNIGDTVTVDEIITPVYNFKASVDTGMDQD